MKKEIDFINNGLLFIMNIKFVILFVDQKELSVHTNIPLLIYKKKPTLTKNMMMVFLKKFVTFVPLEKNGNVSNLHSIFI